ncbi:MAG: cysteine hydrolase [Clostridiales bacterium]|nr:cysteine hydrolase [Clostridiales bacterium]
MKKLLIVVDMQKDFIDGTLGTKEAVEIVPGVVKRIQEYEASGDTIIFTMDTHFEDYMDTQEGKKLPVAHCIKGTDGHKLCKEILELGIQEKCKVYEKLTFGSSEFANDMAAGKYDEYTDIELVGLCTDICVISNAMLVKTFLLNAEVVVDSRLCAGVTPESHKNALEAMKMCQIMVK